MARQDKDKEKETLRIEGMTCSHCLGSVQKALKGLHGISVESVKLGAAVIAYDGDPKKREMAARAIEEAGYKVKKYEDE